MNKILNLFFPVNISQDAMYIVYIWILNLNFKIFFFGLLLLIEYIYFLLSTNPKSPV